MVGVPRDVQGGIYRGMYTTHHGREAYTRVSLYFRRLGGLFMQDSLLLREAGRSLYAGFPLPREAGKPL